MPILQYTCRHCNKNFEELVKNHEQPVFCPVCGAPAERCYNGAMFSATGKTAVKCSGNCANCSGCK